MKNRLLSIFLALALCLTLLPTAALADDEPTGSTGEGITYKNWTGTAFEDATLTDAYTAVAASSGDVTWGEGGKTTWYVVEDSVSISGKVTVNGDVRLILADGKELKITGGIDQGSMGQLTVYGQSNSTGKLTVTGAGNVSEYSKTGVYLGTLTVNGGDVSVTCADNEDVSSSVSNYGIRLSGTSDALTVRGGKLTATAGKVPGGGQSYGVYMQGSPLTVTGGQLIATGGMVGKTNASELNPLTDYGNQNYVGHSSNSCGIYNTKGITVSGGSVTATGGTVEITSGTAKSCGIYYGNSVTVTGGEVNATGGTVKAKSGLAGSYGFYNEYNSNFAVSGGTVNATSGEAVNKNESGGRGESYGIFAGYGNIAVSGGTVNTQTGSVTAGYPDVFDINTHGNDIAITGGTVQKLGTTGGAVVVHGSNVSVTGGTIKLAAGSNAKKFVAPNNEALNALVDTGCAYYEEYWDSDAESDVTRQLDGTNVGNEYTTGELIGQLIGRSVSSGQEYGYIYVHAVSTGDQQPVSYLDARGKTQTCVLYEVLDSDYVTGHTTEERGFWVGDGDRTGDYWLVVKNNLTINSKMKVGSYVDLHLILCDNATLTVAGISGGTYTVTVYAQSKQDTATTKVGKLVSADPAAEDGCGISASDGLTINGGVIEASAQSGYSIYATNGLTINGGTMKLKESYLSNPDKPVTVSNGVKFADLLAEGYAYWQEELDEGWNTVSSGFLKLADLTSVTELKAENTRYYIKACEHSAESGICEYCGKDLDAVPDEPFTPGGGIVVIPSSGTSGSTSGGTAGEKEEPLPFVDVKESDWFSEAVRWAVEQKITGGIEANRFGASLSCTRAQLVTFLWRAAGSPVVNYAMDFTDVDAGAYYGEAVRWANSLGIVGGYGNALFGTGDAITREQMVVMLYRFAVAMGYDVSVGAETNILGYSDAPEIADYAVEAFRWAVGVGIVQGADGKLMPQESCTRGQIVTMLYRMLAKKL